MMPKSYHHACVLIPNIKCIDVQCIQNMFKIHEIKIICFENSCILIDVLIVDEL